MIGSAVVEYVNRHAKVQQQTSYAFYSPLDTFLPRNTPPTRYYPVGGLEIQRGALRRRRRSNYLQQIVI